MALPGTAMLVEGTEVLVGKGYFGSGRKRVLGGPLSLRLNPTIMIHMRPLALIAMVAVQLMAADSKPSAITVRVPPEVLVSVSGTQSVAVRIRLSPGAKAQLWISDNCSIPLPAGYGIGQSGMFEIPIALLPGGGRMVCLMSAQDGLMESVPLIVPKASDPVRCTNSTCYVL